ncbi:hypothetical protein POM88_028519 [Heracleum sosnowskyi]|uniref:Endonuclease/exonuclease/phosphatase domain-containing protein n=1 Tax=Heracleum sosnowskyi TaxID=360622 RepID=A0AAD8HT18_9APIA|nr:hypothetical protein POM88_028519 [Heracleum sosnowskyi]
MEGGNSKLVEMVTTDSIFLDKRGGGLYPQWLIQGFKDVVEDCALIDMNLVGYPFTWERGYGTDKWVEVRLDRALATEEFLNLFRGAKLSNIEVTTSDHCPILLDPGDYVAGPVPDTYRLVSAVHASVQKE